MSYYETIRIPVTHTTESAVKEWSDHGKRVEPGERGIGHLTGLVAWLTIQAPGGVDGGPILYRFKALVYCNHGVPINVTHYASGIRITNINIGDRMEAGAHVSTRAAAQVAINRLAFRHGAGEVVRRIDGGNVRPQLNSTAD